MNLYTPSGVLQAGTMSSASSFNLNTVTLATTDTYTITINPALVETGSIQLQVARSRKQPVCRDVHSLVLTAMLITEGGRQLLTLLFCARIQLARHNVVTDLME